jgi:predicted PurR-regulated permease PerM
MGASVAMNPASVSTNQNGQIVRWMLVAILVVLIFIASWLIRDIILLTLTAVIFSVLLTSPVRFFVRRGIRRPVAVMLTLILVVVIVTSAAFLLLPELLGQFRDLIVIYIPRAAEQIQQELQPQNLIARFPFLEGLDLRPVINQISTQFLGGLANVTAQVLPFVSSLASVFLSILIVFFLAMYFIADPETHERGLLMLVPPRYRTRAQEISGKLDLVLRKFLQAQIVLMIMIGVSTGIALFLIGMPLAGVLGTITALFSFVPNFGPLVALVPILAVALINTPDKLLLIVVVYYVLQFIQSQLITPLLLGQEVNLPPAVILLSQIVSGIFFGFLGLLLSAPLAAIAVVLIREIYVKDILGDRSVEEEKPVPHILGTEMETDGV